MRTAFVGEMAALAGHGVCNPTLQTELPFTVAQRRLRSQARRLSRPRGVGFVACISVALGLFTTWQSVSSFVSAPSKRVNAGHREVGGALQAEPSRRELTSRRSVAQQVAPATVDEGMCTVLTTLLQKAEKAEHIINTPKFLEKDGALNFEEFRSLIEKLEVECSIEEARSAFDEIDTDGQGLLEPIDFRHRLRSSGAISGMYRSSLMNVAYTVVPALLLAVLFGVFRGQSDGVDFLTGYIVEDSLSVDNLFVFIALFKYFKVPPRLQKLCLDVGIVGAMILRAIFIFGGLALVKAFQPFLLLFSAFLLYTAYRTLFVEDDDDEEEDGPPDAVQTVLRMLPTTPSYSGDKFVVQDGKTGQWLATPLAVCIVAVELCDILFAVDSVPAIFAITSDPVIVYSSNIAAIIGLRSLYQVLSIAVQDLVYLEKAVAIVLGFVGLKLAGEVFGAEVDSLMSLMVIVGILGGGVFLSLQEEEKRRRAAAAEST